MSEESMGLTKANLMDVGRENDTRQTTGIDNYMVSGAQSVTTTAGTSAAITTVSYSSTHGVTRSSPAPLLLVNTNPSTSSPSVLAQSQTQTRPPTLSTNSHISKDQRQQLISQQTTNVQFLRPKVTSQTHQQLQLKASLLQQHHKQQQQQQIQQAAQSSQLVQLLLKGKHDSSFKAPVLSQQQNKVVPTPQKQLQFGITPQQQTKNTPAALPKLLQFGDTPPKQIQFQREIVKDTSPTGGVAVPQTKLTLSTSAAQQFLLKQLLHRNTWKLHRQQQQQQQQVLKPGDTRKLQPLSLQKAPQTLQTHQETSELPVSRETGGSSHMTFGVVEAKEGPADKMESRYTSSSDISPYVSTCCDLSHSTDLVDTSIYASSPNSLFMYEQEKVDMQGTLGVNSTCTSTFADDFELKSQYEASKDISSCLPVCTTVCDQTMTSSMICDSGGGLWGDNTKQNEKEEVLIKSENLDDGSAAPTLAELNLDLLDDIETFINVEMNHSPAATRIKVEADTSHEKEKVQEPGQQGGVSSEPVLATMTAIIPQPLYDTKLVTVKTEPVDVAESGQINNYQSSFLSMLSSEPKPRPVTQNSKQSRPVLDTIRAIDISDATTLQQLLLNRPITSQARPRNRTVSESTALKSPTRKRSSMSAGLESMDKKWEEIKQFIYTEPRMIEEATKMSSYPPVQVKHERKRYDSASSAVTLTSNEDEDSDSDRDYDDDSDSDFEGGHDITALNPAESLIGSKDKQFFWQYNVQSKGPKGTRVHFDLEEDPHVLHDFEDPVFDPTNSKLPGIGVSIKHGGKARKGDGNDIVPSPKKLCQIGLQLRKISRQINDFIPVSELPSAARGKTRKEKNKLASRACRLKKKAQHEANKVKLHGLELEHRQLITVIRKIRVKLIEKLQNKGDKSSMTEVLESLIKEHLETMIGGNTADYVNRVVRRVEEGDTSGGIQIQATRSYPKELHN